MPDPILILLAMSTSLAVSTALMGVIGWFGRRTSASVMDTGWILGIGAGFSPAAGCSEFGLTGVHAKTWIVFSS